MRKGFTLVECIIAGAILSLVISAFMQALSVINRVEHENAQYLEADAILWDKIAEMLNTDYAKILSGKRTYTEKVGTFPAEVYVNFDGTDNIEAGIEWNGRGLTNRVMRSKFNRIREDDL